MGDSYIWETVDDWKNLIAQNPLLGYNELNRAPLAKDWDVYLLEREDSINGFPYGGGAPYCVCELKDWRICDRILFYDLEEAQAEFATRRANKG
jgi:hypothetical protein